MESISVNGMVFTMAGAVSSMLNSVFTTLENIELDINLFINLTSIISLFFITLIASLTVFHKLKVRWPVKTKCWFCHNIAKIPVKSLDWWMCPHCEQFNGFSKDGDYNYDIPEQYGIKRSAENESYCLKKSFTTQNTLCKECNRKEELKLMKLRKLENSMVLHDDDQLAKFEQSFEKKYPLCLSCQSVVKKVLFNQSLWFSQYKKILLNQKPFKRIIKNRKSIEKVLQITLSILAAVSIYYSKNCFLPLCGICVQVISCLICDTKKRQYIFPLLGWMCFIFIRSVSTTAVVNIINHFSNGQRTLNNDNINQYFIVCLGVGVALANLKFYIHTSSINNSLSFKKLGTSNKNTPSSKTNTPLSFNEETTVEERPQRKMANSPVNITDSLMTPLAVEIPIPIKPKVNIEWLLDAKKKTEAYNSSYQTPVVNLEHLSNESSIFNESLNHLNSLSLSKKAKKPSMNSRQVFETKTYANSSPDIFRSNILQPKRSSILAPAKLRCAVTQTSWVAGGYWQAGLETPISLSRSSSQSSGVGSSNSNPIPSRDPSLPDLDERSGISDHFCKNYVRQQSLKSPLTIQRTRKCDSPFSECDSFEYVHSECPGHTTTVIRNPMWLSVLLCGSIIFNAIVLCTILLR